MQRRWPVVLVVGLDAVDERQFVGVAGQVRKAVGHPAAALAVLRELKRAADGDVREREAPLQFAGDLGDAGKRLAVQLAQSGLVLERVHLAHAALHEQEDAVLRLAREMRLPRGKRIRLANAGAEVVHQHAAQAKRPNAVPGTGEELPAVWPSARTHLNAENLAPYRANSRRKNNRQPPLNRPPTGIAGGRRVIRLCLNRRPSPITVVA